MSTQTPPAPYPSLLRWLAGEAPDTSKIAAELTAMAGRPHYARFLLDLEDEREAFRTALLVAFPQLDLDKPDFSKAKGALTAVASPTLHTAGPVCLVSLALGEPRDAFNRAHLWTAPDGVLRYKGGTVYVTSGNRRMRVSVEADGRLYVASAAHPLKLWIRKNSQDATLQEIFGVVAGAGAGGYDALSAQGVVAWESSPGGPLDTPKGLVQVITKSGAFRSIAWGTPYCTAGWVDSLMPTLLTQGTIAGPGGPKTIGQNVHSAQIVGSAWMPGVDNLDCKPAEMPPQWQGDVAATLCPLAANHVQLRLITEFCDILKAAKPTPFVPGGSDLAARITYILTHHPDRRKDLESLPNIKVYYKQCF
ncbi:hypothetical protein ACIPW5_03810 [Streptomyces sp. NPDC090077]|uniref:hypothetical protein n=1 Tax=Streptomyces sp. NPDC090077 TaxID=3365938 RepID=UPI00382A3FE5